MAIVGLVIGGSAVYYIFNMPARNIEKEKPSYSLPAAQLINEFATNENSSYTKYGNKVIQVTGEIADIYNSEGVVTLLLGDAMSGVSCSMDSMAVVKFKPQIEALNVGTEVSLKGKLDGYDMIMGVVLTRCYLVKEE